MSFMTQAGSLRPLEMEIIINININIINNININITNINIIIMQPNSTDLLFLLSDCGAVVVSHNTIHFNV